MFQPPTITVGRQQVDSHYRETMLTRLLNIVTESLGQALRFPDGYKPMLKPEGIKKYNGSSKFSDLEQWLATLTNRYALMKFGGDDFDTDRVRVLSVADYLEGDALQWFSAHVLGARRTVARWLFTDVV